MSHRSMNHSVERSEYLECTCRSIRVVFVKSLIVSSLSSPFKGLRRAHFQPVEQDFTPHSLSRNETGVNSSLMSA